MCGKTSAMTQPHDNAVNLVGDWRGDLLESVHQGHAVVVDQSGEVVQSWGDPDVLIYPRSSVKMIQALPLVESGAADAIGLSTTQLALACASHHGGAIHVDGVQAWLSDIGLSDGDLICGPHEPLNTDMRNSLIQAGQDPCRVHNNCSGKHAGFLTLCQHLKANFNYVETTHPIQVAIKSALEELAQTTSPTYGIDGCSAPNFAIPLRGLARAMAFFATAQDRSDTRSRAAARLALAMRQHPELVSGEGESCTDLMRAMGGAATVKIGADGVYIAILPDQRLGVALKIADGSMRAAECAMANLLIKLGALDPGHPIAQNRATVAITNAAGLKTGQVRPFATLQ